MKQIRLSMNPVQMIIGLTKILLFFLFPLAVFQVPGFGQIMGFTALDIYSFGSMWCMVPLISAILITLFSTGPLRKYGVFAAGFAFVVEIILAANMPLVLPLGVIQDLVRSIVPDLEQPLIDFSEFLNSLVDIGIKLFPSAETAIRLLEKLILFIVQSFPQYFDQIQEAASLFTMSVRELMETVYRLLVTIIRPSSGYLVSIFLTVIYAVFHFILPVNKPIGDSALE